MMSAKTFFEQLDYVLVLVLSEQLAYVLVLVLVLSETHSVFIWYWYQLKEFCCGGKTTY